MKWCRGKGWGQHEAKGIEADSERESNHADNQSRAQHTYAPTLPGQAGIQSTSNHGHTFSMVEIAQEHNEAKEDG